MDVTMTRGRWLWWARWHAKVAWRGGDWRWHARAAFRSLWFALVGQR